MPFHVGIMSTKEKHMSNPHHKNMFSKKHYNTSEKNIKIGELTILHDDYKGEWHLPGFRTTTDEHEAAWHAKKLYMKFFMNQ